MYYPCSRNVRNATECPPRGRAGSFELMPLPRSAVYVLNALAHLRKSIRDLTRDD